MDDVFIPGLVDLFGDPVPKSRGGRGRPAHVPTAENRRFVQLALACGQDETDVARALRIDKRTFRRHYFHELEGKRSARLRLRMKNLGAIVEAAATKPAAMALLEKVLEKLDKREVAARYQVPAPAERPAREKVGVNAARKAAAEEVTGKFAPPKPPRALMN